jgi:hypothetical protein
MSETENPKRQELLVDIRDITLPITKRGRKPIYANDEERHDAKLRQTIKSNKKKKQEKLDFLNRIYAEQKVIIRDLSENIVLNNEQCRYIMALLFRKRLSEEFEESLEELKCEVFVAITRLNRIKHSLEYIYEYDLAI